MTPYAIKYEHEGTVYATVVMAVSEAEAVRLFKHQHPHVKFLKVVE